MGNLFDYLNAAMQRTQANSERKLCEMLQISSNSFTKYRKGSLPSDDTMMKLAQLAGVPPWKALVDLSIWRSENENVKKEWEAVAKKISKAAKVLIISLVTGLIVYAPPAFASTLENAAQSGGDYILRKIELNRIRGVLRKIMLRFFNALL